MSTGKAGSELKVAFRRHPLDAIFAPRNVAVIGATEKEDSVGRTMLWNLISNPSAAPSSRSTPSAPMSWASTPTPRIADVPEQVDLAVIVTPAPTVPGVIDECVRGGRQGRDHHLGRLQGDRPRRRRAGAGRSSSRRARGQMRIIGPNCLGVMSPLTGINATFAKGMARPGNVGFISQSGALCTVGARLEPARRTSASAPSSPSARCSTWTGAT